MNIHCIVHVPFEGPGMIIDWAAKKNAVIQYTRMYDFRSFPSPDSFDLLIVLGGSMSVNDETEFPWLTEEKEFIRTVIKKEKKIFGICLGAQLIASALGKKVYRNHEKEIGWYPVHFSQEIKKNPPFDHFPDRGTVFHWHGETFDIPDGAVLVGSSEACINQGFLYGPHILALQFHLEETRESLEKLLQESVRDLTPGKWVQSPDQILDGLINLADTRKMLFPMLEKFIHA